jgi:hypothetical protein
MDDFGRMPGDVPGSGSSCVIKLVPRVTSRVEDVESAKRIVDDGEEDSLISIFLWRRLRARARVIIFMRADARCAMR